MIEKEMSSERKPNRLKGYDYSNLGWYYVTICTKEHVAYFGRVKNGEMFLNKLGKMAKKFWNEIPEHFPEIELDEYVIMPNHIHGIIIINNMDVGTRHALSLQQQSPKHNLGNIIGSFKSAVSKYAHENEYKHFKWQRSFYDRIIRNEKELYFIRRYIQQNPLKWELEKNIDNLEI